MAYKLARYFCEYKRKSNYSTKTSQKESIDSGQIVGIEQEERARFVPYKYCVMQDVQPRLLSRKYSSENFHSFQVHSNIKYNVELSTSDSQLSYEQEAVLGRSSHNIRKTTLRESKPVRLQFIKKGNWVTHPCLNLMQWLFVQ